MSYIDSVLEPGERVLYRTGPSWTLYAPAIGLAICSGACLIAGLEISTLGLVAEIGAVLFGLAALALAARAWFRRWTSEVAVTDRRIIVKRGFIRRHTVEMNMAKIESVDVDQTLIGRIFDFGDVSVRGTGTTFETLRRIDAPLKLRSTVTAG